MRSHLSFWVGFFAAALLAVPIAGGIMRSAGERVLDVAIVLFVGVATLVVFLVFVLLFRDWILRKLVGRTEVALEDVAGALVKSVAAASAGDRDAAATHAQTFVQAGIGWYTWSNFYRWVFATALGLLVAFGAFWGTVLLFEQTRTLRLQTERIADQTDLMAAQTSLMEAQTERLEEQTTAAMIQNEIMTVTLVSELREQILSTSSEVTLNNLVSETGELTTEDILATDSGSNCAIRFSDDVRLTRPPSAATIRAIAGLGRRGELAPRVREALDFLSEDNEPVVALTAVRILDEIGTDRTYRLSDLTNLFVDELVMKGAHSLDFDTSLVVGLDCPSCAVRVTRGLVRLGAESFSTALDSIVLVNNEDQPDQLCTPSFSSLVFCTEKPSPVPQFAVPLTVTEAFANSGIGQYAFLDGNKACPSLKDFARQNPFAVYDKLKN